MTGNSSALIVADRTTPANYYAGIVNNNEWRWTYNGTEIGPYIATDGRYKIGNGGTPETVIGTLNINKSYTFAGITGALGAGGAALNIEDATYTLSGGGGFTTFNGNFIGIPTVAAPSAATYTDAITLDIKGAPVAGTNTTLTNKYALRVLAGKTQLNGVVTGQRRLRRQYKSIHKRCERERFVGANLNNRFLHANINRSCNVAASTSALCYYYRIGSEVTVYGTLQIDPTAATTLTQIGLSIPVASTFTTSTQAAGTFAFNNGEAGIVISDASNGRAELQFTPTTGTNRTYWFQFSYHVQ
jgi:hypothetical protein